MRALAFQSYVHAMLMTGIRWIFCLTRTMQVMTVPVASLFVQLQPQGLFQLKFTLVHSSLMRLLT